MMNYEERKKYIESWVINFLSDYEVPSTFDKQRAQKEIQYFWSDLNRKIPNDFNKESIGLLFDFVGQHCRENMNGRTWPSIKLALNGLKIALERSQSKTETRINESPFDEIKINAKRVKAGDSIGVEFLSGKNKNRLIATGIVEESDFQKYQKYLDKNIDVA